MTDKVRRDALKPGQLVHWYEIKRVLGQGGFGITYLAHDTNLHQLVAIKEYLPTEFAVREADGTVQPRSDADLERYRFGLSRFIGEARTLARFDHPNIVRVMSIFEARNTAYMAMQYEDGENLRDILDRRKTLSEAELLQILLPLLDGLALVHAAGFIHRDIQPANIYVRNDGSPVLLDFGAARQSVGRTQTITILVSPGYAPLEQYYASGGQQGPWTDIYALGATMYRAVAGIPPIDAIERSQGILGSTRDILVPATVIGRSRYSARFLAAIDHALRFAEKDRPQSVLEWRRELCDDAAPVKNSAAMGAGEAEGVQASKSSIAPANGSAGRRKALGLAAALVGLIAAFTAGTFLRRPIPTDHGSATTSGVIMELRAEISRLRDRVDELDRPSPAAQHLPPTPTVAKRPASSETVAAANATPGVPTTTAATLPGGRRAITPKALEVVSTASRQSEASTAVSPSADTKSAMDLESADRQTPPARPQEIPLPPTSSRSTLVRSASSAATRQTAKRQEPPAEVATESAEPPQASASTVASPAGRTQASALTPAHEPENSSVEPEAPPASPDSQLQGAKTAYKRGDYPHAFATMEPLARNGQPEAQYYLSLMYETGSGTSRDTDRATSLLRQAANGGIVEAQMKLAHMYAAGQGVPKDPFYAYVWYAVAASTGSAAATQQRDAAADALQPMERRQAEALSSSIRARIDR